MATTPIINDDWGWADYPPRSIVIADPEPWGWTNTAPVPRWSLPAATPRQEIFVVVLESDGLDPFELPVSTITMRLRNGGASYIGVIVPNPTRYTREILGRIEGRVRIYGGYQTAAGRHIEEIIYANIQTLYFSEGAGNLLTLAGTRYVTNASPKAVTLPGVSAISKDSGGRVTVRCAFDLWARPGDTATTFGESFEIDLITAVVTKSDAYMDVVGA